MAENTLLALWSLQHRPVKIIGKLLIDEGVVIFSDLDRLRSNGCLGDDGMLTEFGRSMVPKAVSHVTRVRTMQAVRRETLALRGLSAVNAAGEKKAGRYAILLLAHEGLLKLDPGGIIRPTKGTRYAGDDRQ